MLIQQFQLQSLGLTNLSLPPYTLDALKATNVQARKQLRRSECCSSTMLEWLCGNCTLNTGYEIVVLNPRPTRLMDTLS